MLSPWLFTDTSLVSLLASPVTRSSRSCSLTVPSVSTDPGVITRPALQLIPSPTKRGLWTVESIMDLAVFRNKELIYMYIQSEERSLASIELYSTFTMQPICALLASWLLFPFFSLVRPLLNIGKHSYTVALQAPRTSSQASRA